MERRISESGEELCTVCSEVINIFATGQCDHRVCYKCATRMRVLCDQLYCAICRTDLPKIAFTRECVKFDALNLKMFKMHQKYNIFFENDFVRMAFFEVQEHRCRVCRETKTFKSFPALKDHMKKEHTLFPCDLCVKHIKLFSSERKFYDRKKLGTHRRIGDEEDKSHKGHPLCKFCDERYLDNDELVRHLRKDHYYCHFCESDGVSNEFYGDYSYLRKHFLESHFLCEEGDCRNIQFTTAFRHELDLKAHMASMHSKNLKKGMAKAVRTLDVDINLVPRPYQDRFNRGAHKGKGVVGPSDFTEVAAQEKQQGACGRGQNLRYLRERREREREEAQLAKAITASLNAASQTSVSVVDGNLLPKKEPEKPPPEPLKKSDYNQNDFPGLSGKELKETKDNKSSDSDEEKKSSVNSDSMAKKVARAKGFNVQDGDMNEEDFPSLGPGSTKQWAHPTKAATARWNKPEDFPDLGASAKPRIVQAAPTWNTTTKSQKQSYVRSSQTKTNPGQPLGKSQANSGTSGGVAAHVKPDTSHFGSASDFPNLNSIGYSLTKGLSSGTASDALVQYASAGVSTSVRQSNVKVIETKPDDKPVAVMAKPAIMSTDFPSLSSNRKEDFPSLGKAGTKQNSWGPKPKVEKAVPQNTGSGEENTGYLKMKKNSKNKKVAQNCLSSEDSSESIKSWNGKESISLREMGESLIEKDPSGGSNAGSKNKKTSGKKKSKAMEEEPVCDRSSDIGSQNKKAVEKKKSEAMEEELMFDRDFPASLGTGSQSKKTAEKKKSKAMEEEPVCDRSSDIGSQNKKAVEKKKSKAMEEELMFDRDFPASLGTGSQSKKTAEKKKSKGIEEEPVCDRSSDIGSQNKKAVEKKKSKAMEEELMFDRDFPASLGTGSQSKKTAEKKKSKAMEEEPMLDRKFSASSAAESQSKKTVEKKKSKLAKNAKDSNSDIKPKGKVSPEPMADNLPAPKENATAESTESISSTLETVTYPILDFPSIHDIHSKSDFVPAVSAILPGADGEVNPKKLGKKSAYVNDENDFPVLGGSSKTETVTAPPVGFGMHTFKVNAVPPPPPGFSKAPAVADKKNLPPPGFNSDVAGAGKKNPPPGFETKASSAGTASSDLAGIAKLLSSVTDSKQPMSVPAENGSFQRMGNDGAMKGHIYVKPDDFSARNQKLISDIVLLLENDQDKFLIFKTLSSDFRKGVLSAIDYYTSCSQVIGAEKFNAIFTELLVLLPDIVKQQNLLSAHRATSTGKPTKNQSKKSRGKGWNVPESSQGFTICPICEQVLLSKEATHHVSKHNNDSDFPMLGAS